MVQAAQNGVTKMAGSASGAMLWSDVGQNFWRGIDPESGVVIDRHRPLCGRSVRNAVLAIPAGRGACTGSSVVLELFLNGNALSAEDQRMRDGDGGRARLVAMDITVHMAQSGAAARLIDISQVHIDGCTCIGSASLRFAGRLVEWDGKVAVLTSLNVISVARCGWRGQGIPAAFGEPADALARACVDLRAAPTYTCAPYQLASAPVAGRHIAWAEPNAVVYANSVIGARSAKYPDILDALMALPGRAPEADCHLDVPRKTRIRFDLAQMGPHCHESLYPLLGYPVGLLSGRAIPVICGLESAAPSLGDLQALGAGVARAQYGGGRYGGACRARQPALFRRRDRRPGLPVRRADQVRGGRGHHHDQPPCARAAGRRAAALCAAQLWRAFCCRHLLVQVAGASRAGPCPHRHDELRKVRTLRVHGSGRSELCCASAGQIAELRRASPFRHPKVSGTLSPTTTHCLKAPWNTWIGAPLH